MGQMLYSAAGAVVGWVASGFNPTGAYYGWMAGAAIGALVEKPGAIKGPMLDDLNIIGTEYGLCIPMVFGHPRLAGQIIWASQVRPIANTQKAGKGGGQKSTTFTYEVDVLIMLSENVTAGVARQWVNAEMIYNGVVTKAGVWSDVRIYPGDADQLPDPTYEAAVGVGRAPAYRGHTTIMVIGLQLGAGKNLPNMEAEVGASGSDGTEYGFLNQFDEIDPVDTVPSEIGPDAVRTAPSLPAPVLNTISQRFGTASASGAMRTENFTADFQTKPWRAEGWVKPIYTDSALPQGYIANLEFLSGQYLQWYLGGPFSAFEINYAITGSAGGEILGETGFPRPVEGNWYHWAIQQNPDTNTLSFHFAGQYVDSFVLGPGLPPIAATGGRITFNGEAISRMEFDSTVVRTFEDNTQLLPINAPYSVPTEPFSVAQGPMVPWYDTTPDPQGLRKAVDALMERAGYFPDQYDTSALNAITQPLRGYAVSQVTSTRSALEPLRPVFFFESATSEKIEFFPRAVTPAGVIDWRDLSCSESRDNNEEPFMLQIGNESELPAQIALRYANMAADHNAGTEFSDRLVSSQLTTQQTEVPLSLMPEEAKRAVTSMLLDMAAGLGRATIRLPLKYAKYRPGDIVTLVDFSGRAYRLRILIKRDSTVVIEFDVVLDEASALTNPVVTDEGYELITEPIAVPRSLWEAMDVPILRDADNNAGFYVAITPEIETLQYDWPGAVFVRSWGAENFQQEFTTPDACVMGECLTTLGDFAGGSNRFDETNRLRVKVRGELEGTTRDDMLDDLSINAALVGDGELIRFRDAVLIDSEQDGNTYDLTGFIRGQRGTEQHIDGHAGGERFVLLNGLMRRVVDQNSDIDLPSEVKAVTLNTLLSEVDAEDFTNTGVSLMPFSVANLRALAEGADVEVSWQRRSRMSYRYGGTVGVSVPLGEAVEAYRVKVYDGVALVNTYPATSSPFTYLAADIAADGFAPGDPIGIEVVQLSEIVGEGFPAETQGIAP